MEKFKFKLQNVLDYRVEVEEKQKDEFIKAQKALMKEKKIIEELLQLKDTAVNDKNNYNSKLDYQLLLNYINVMDSKITEQMDRVIKAQEFFDRKKQELIKSTSDRKVIEKLKETAKREFEFEMNKVEQRMNDDFALFTYVRNEGR